VPLEHEFEELSLATDENNNDERAGVKTARNSVCCHSTLGCRVRDVGWDIDGDYEYEEL
jgi:hypothetical protein